MGVKELVKLGDVADEIAKSVTEIYSINNTQGNRYDALLSRARTLANNPTLLLADLTDAQINNGLLEGRGTSEDIAETRAAMVARENIIIKIRAEIANPDFPANNLGS